MPDRVYSLYGIRFRSHWPLPYTEVADGDLYDLRLVEDSPQFFADAALEAGWPSASTDWFHHGHLEDGSVYLRWKEHFEFVVSPDGGRIAGRSLSTTSAEAFQTYLLGQVLSFALLKRGTDPLHGTAVVVDEAAIAFLGDCGYGKSSLAAAFLAAGQRVLTDDLLVVRPDAARPDAGGFTAYPGPPRIKLSPEMADAVLETQNGCARMNSFTPKLILPLPPHQVRDTPVPLKAIYVLAPSRPRAQGDRVTIRRLSQRKAFMELLRNAFNAQVTDRDRLERQFRQASRLVAAVPIKSLSYRRHTSMLPAVREMILADCGITITVERADMIETR
jgi:hypothetical protein